MGLGKLVKSAYDKSTSSIKKDRTFLTASVLASVACATDALTTRLGMVKNPVFDMREVNNFAAYLINELGVNKGLALESLITVGVAVPLAYTFNKIMREEWIPANYIKKKVGINRGEEIKPSLPRFLKKDFGTYYFYALSVASIYGAFNNTYIYYMIKGLITAKTHLPF
jgi:hypothetical protein